MRKFHFTLLNPFRIIFFLPWGATLFLLSWQTKGWSILPITTNNHRYHLFGLSTSSSRRFVQSATATATGATTTAVSKEAVATVAPSSFNRTTSSVIIRGRGVPYCETFEEQSLRRIWESNPFETTQSVVDAIITNKEKSQMSPLLRRIDTDDTYLPSSFEYLFDIMYKGNNNGGDDGDGMLSKEGYDDDSVETSPRKHQRKDKLSHYKIHVAYRGERFCGWQTQPNNLVLPSVQKTLEDWLEPINGKKVNLRVCGRTDAGVSAIGQVCRFRTQQKHLDTDSIQQHLDQLASKTNDIGITRVDQVTRAFHPIFAATCRAYAFMIDTEAIMTTPTEFDTIQILHRLNALLQQLQGKELAYLGMSYGKLKTESSDCILYHARASLVETTRTDDCAKNGNQTQNQAICIELVGNRFLRRMVRLLVSKALYLTLKRPDDSTTFDKMELIDIIQQMDRNLATMPAPPGGLIFVSAEFEKE